MVKSGHKLMIVESPAKAKTIAKYLDHEYVVRASVGHVRDLPKSNKNAIDIKSGFVPHYEISPGKDAVVSELIRLAAQAPEVILATDPDREGEAIAWHVAEACRLKHPRRVVFHEITRDAVREALKHPRPIDQNLRQAQEARRVLDRLFGYDLSGLIWQKLRYGLSAGRVQSPALRILVEREREIRSFVSRKFWVIEAELADSTNRVVLFTCSQELATAEAAEAIVTAGRAVKWTISNVATTAARRAPRPPFITSTLQQSASSRFGFSPSLTMRLAQKLYEAGHITYMRTDSTNLNSAAVSEILACAKEKFGSRFSDQPRIYKTKSKSAQEAHEAIRPTHIRTFKAGRSDGEQKLYDLIWRRTLCSQMSDAELLRTRLEAQAGDPAIPIFESTGHQIVFAGWLEADPRARGEEIELPNWQNGQALELKKMESLGKETQPPNRYSEAGLVKELEKRGIGRPSTYAPTIKTIVDRGYVTKQNRTLQPTETGEVVSTFLEKNFADYISDSFTAKMEDELDDVAAGKLSYRKSLEAFYQPFHRAVVDKKDLPKINNLGPVSSEFPCPICGGAMVFKLGKSGKFMSCDRFPDCVGARTAEGKEIAPPRILNEICPRCGHGQLVERDGRYGRFIACGNYPKCRYVKKEERTDGLPAAGDTGVKCPMCHTGTMTEKRGRYGIFYGCSNYPSCKHIVKTKPTGKICGYQREIGPCPHLMMVGTKTIPDRCSDKTCPNHNPHKLQT
ncbi:MAG: type I DNA topoisomerase [Patescibacteria group bacterium]|mgnify:CR=1 FL=1